MKKAFTLVVVFMCTAFATMAQVPTSGLVAYYSFDGNANDGINSINGTATATTASVNRFGTANSSYYFNGTSSYVSITHNSALIDLTNTFSLSLWFKADVGFYDRSCLFYTRMDAAGAEQGGIGVDYTPGGTSASPTFSCYKPGTTTHSLTSAVLTNNVWHHVVIVYVKNDKGYLYIDGAAAGTTSTISSLFLASSPIRIGAAYGDPGTGATWKQFFKGSIDDIRIYNRALNSTEVSALYDENGFTTGVANATSTGSLILFPNPATDQITLQNPYYSTLEGYTITVLNLFGEQVYTHSAAQEMFTISKAELKGKGLYLVRVTDPQNNVVETQKVILQ